MAYGAPVTVSDPTNVMGRRIAAWFVDLIPALVLGAIVAGSGLTRHEGVTSDFCTRWRFDHSSSICFTSGSTAYTSQGFRGSGLLVSLLYWFAVAGLLQGATGASIGKHMVGLRVVDQNGNICGIGKAMLRTLIGVFEIGFCFLVALITASVTHPHRRLGDFAAGTFVVAKESVGRPIMSGAPSGYPPPWSPPGGPTTWGPPPAAGSQPWGTPAPGWGSPPAASPPPSASPPTWGTPAAAPPATTPAPETPATWGTPAAAPPASEPAPTETPATQTPAATPGGDAPGWGAPSAAQPPAAQPAATESAPLPQRREPQWDAQRNAWVYWEAETSRWLQHDPTTGKWGPLR
ncbi:MAG: hypothetical protein QOH10_325 [Actinomycetota bacterium]|nr:hypothetical protein [Actinomycetota bacterium]